MLLFAAFAFVVAQAAAVPPFGGITIGESEAALIAQMGEPAMRRTLSPTVGEDLFAAGNHTFETVRVERGNVVVVRLQPSATKLQPGDTPPSSLGIALGDPWSKVLALKNRLVKTMKAGDRTTRLYAGVDGLDYGFVEHAGTVSMLFAGFDPLKTRALPASSDPAPVLHGGTSFEDAIVLKAPSEDVGVQNEYLYLTLHPCTRGGRWSVSQQAVQTHGGVPYDVLTATCATDATQRAFYFNIAGYYGKP